MDWIERFGGVLERAFQHEYLKSDAGGLYGAGETLDTSAIFQSVVSAEELEHYPEVLIDEWATYHLLDNISDIEPLIRFDFQTADGHAGVVHFILVDVSTNRIFVARKTPHASVEVIAALDRDALGDLISPFLMTLLASGLAFGDERMDVLPEQVENLRPDLLSIQHLRRGLQLLGTRMASEDPNWIEALRERVKEGGEPAFLRSLGVLQDDDLKESRRDVIDLYFESIYREADLP